MLNDVFNPTLYHYTFPAWPPVIVGSCLILLGWGVVLRERASKVSTAFAWLTLSAAVWLVSFSGIYSAIQPDIALWWARVEHAGVVFIPSALLYFTLIVVKKFDRYRFQAVLAVAISGIFALSIFLSNHYVTGMTRYPWGLYPRYGGLGSLFLAYFFSLYALSLTLFWNAYHQIPDGSHQERLKSFFYAFCVGVLGTIDFLPCYGVAIYPVGYLPVYTSALMLAQVIWRYRFPDITPAFAATQIIATMPSALLVLDHDGVICIVNETTCQMFGKSATDLIGNPLSTLFSEFTNNKHIENVLLDSSTPEYEAMVRNAEGQPRFCSFSTSIIQDDSQRLLAYVCLARDITERRRMEQALRISESRFRRLMESNIIGFMLVNLKGQVLEANDAFLKMLGYSREELAAGQVGGPGMTPAEYHPVDQWMEDRLQKTGLCPPVEKEYLCKDSSRIPVLVGVVRLERTSDECLCFVIDASERRAAQKALEKAYDELEIRIDERTVELKQEILRREHAEEALRNQSVTDALTGLYNRRGFVSLAEQHLALARRKKRGFLLFMADLDDLKPINDTYGHAEGDYALAQAAALLKHTFRNSDIVARIGGDEFAVAVIEEEENTETTLAARLLERLDDFNRYSGRHYKLGLSMGSERLEAHDTRTIEQLMVRADAALYEKKRHKTGRSATPRSGIT